MQPVSASPPKGMLRMLMFSPRRFYHAAAIDAVERHLIEADASRKRRAEVVDRMAAAYILQGALERLRRLEQR